MKKRKSVLDYKSPTYEILQRIYAKPGLKIDELCGDDTAKTTTEAYLNELVISKKVKSSNGKYYLTKKGVAYFTEELLKDVNK